MRSYLIRGLEALDADPHVLLDRWDHEPDVSARRALLLSLGGFRTDRFSVPERKAFLTRLWTPYQSDPDAGIHSAIEWLARSWGAEAELAMVDSDLKPLPAVKNANWQVTEHGHTLVALDGRRQPTGLPQIKKVNRQFDIATKEVTLGQFRRFRPGHGEGNSAEDLSRPVGAISWFDAAAYCRWLSEQEHIPEHEMCYPPIKDIKDGMQPYKDYLSRSGYRLPGSRGNMRAGLDPPRNVFLVTARTCFLTMPGSMPTQEGRRIRLAA